MLGKIGIAAGVLCVIGLVVLIVIAQAKERHEQSRRLYEEPVQREAIARGFATYEIQPDGTALFVWTDPPRAPNAPRPDRGKE